VELQRSRILVRGGEPHGQRVERIVAARRRICDLPEAPQRRIRDAWSVTVQVSAVCAEKTRTAGYRRFRYPGRESFMGF
jgi:hypothetical protein